MVLLKHPPQPHCLVKCAKSNQHVYDISTQKIVQNRSLVFKTLIIK